jgi:acetyl-CoA acetyltransferase
MRDVVMVGAGLHRYRVFPEKNAIELGAVAIQRALDDAGCQWTDIEAVYCGGLISMGHPLGPTGLRQIVEILWQMRRTADPRQIPQDVHVALAHMVGAGGVCVIHMLRQ